MEGHQQTVCLAGRNVSRRSTVTVGATTQILAQRADQRPIHDFAMHGMLSRLFGHGRSGHGCEWSIRRQSSQSWSVWWRDPDYMHFFTDQVRNVSYGTISARLIIGELCPALVIAPRMSTARSFLLKTQSPVAIRSAKTGDYMATPTNQGIASTLAHKVGEIVGITVVAADLDVSIAHQDTRTETRYLGGKLGKVSGWSGAIIIECCSLAGWLLQAAAAGPGIGGRTAYGCGQIEIRVLK